jgi:hypothetical protein
MISPQAKQRQKREKSSDYSSRQNYPQTKEEIIQKISREDIRESPERVKEINLIIKLYDSDHNPFTLPIVCNEKTAKEIFYGGTRLYTSKDGNYSGYRFPCEECVGSIVELDDGSIVKIESGVCPFLKRDEEKERYTYTEDSYCKSLLGIGGKPIVKSISLRCEKYKFNREINL